MNRVVALTGNEYASLYVEISPDGKMTTQKKMEAMLKKADIPSKEIKVFGSQILITAWSQDAARKWAALLAKFATVRGIVESIDENVDQAAWFKDRPGIVKNTATHKVWRVGAYI